MLFLPPSKNFQRYLILSLLKNKTQLTPRYRGKMLLLAPVMFVLPTRPLADLAAVSIQGET